MSAKQHKEAAEKCLRDSQLKPLEEAAVLLLQSIAHSLIVLESRLKGIETAVMGMTPKVMS